MLYSNTESKSITGWMIESVFGNKEVKTGQNKKVKR